MTDPKGQTVAYEYDTLRRVTKVSTTAGDQTYQNEYTYDGTTGHLTSVAHNTTGTACDVQYNFTYDSMGRKVGVAVGTQTLSTSEYQDNQELKNYGTLKKMTYGNNTTVENKYDDFNRVKAVHYNGENTPRYEYAYNAKGQVAHVTHNTTDDTGAAVKVVTESEYDLSDRPIRVKEHEGSKHVYTGEVAYNDEFGVLSEFREKVGENRTEYVTSFGYDDQNRPITLGYGSYGGSTTTYDALNRVTVSTVNLGSYTHTSTYHFIPGGHTDHGTGSVTSMVASITQPGGSCSYGYDDNGNIANATVNGKWASYAYDALGQLIRLNDRSDTRAGTDGSTWTYEYDQGGNILKKTMFAYNDHYGQALEVTEFEYDATWKDQLKKITVTCYDSNGNPTSVSTQNLDYDDIGNPTTDGTWAYTWQNGRQLAGMSKSGTTVSFKYNANGLRTRKIVNGVMTKYTLHGKNVMHMTRGNDNLHFFYDAQNRPAVVVYNGTAYAYVKNLQGDIIAILDSAGATVVNYTYDAWGAPTGTTGSMATSLGVLNPFRYRGYVFDEETEYFYLRSRYYASNVCRFINSDTIIGKNRLGFHNLYSYCANDPTNAIDHQGTEPFDLFETELDAVFDFADLYSNSKVEVSALICRYGDKYFYGTPSQGDEKNSTIPPVDPRLVNIVTPVTYVHTHPDGVKGTTPTIPSEQDIYALCAGAYTRSYLVVFDGSVLKMDRESDIPTLPAIATNDEKFDVLMNTKVYALRGPVHKVLGDKGLGYIEYTAESSEVYSKSKKRRR